MFSVTILRGQYEAGKYEGETFVPGESYWLTLKASVACLHYAFDNSNILFCCPYWPKFFIANRITHI